MTFSAIKNHEVGDNKNLIGTIFGRILSYAKKFRPEPKVVERPYYYHTEEAAMLEQAKRDVNRVWLG